VPSNPIYDKRTPHYRKAHVFPPNGTKWWGKNHQSPIVKAVVGYAILQTKPFTVTRIYEEARYYNGNLVRASGVMSPTKERVLAIIRYCGYFIPTESFVNVDGRQGGEDSFQ